MNFRLKPICRCLLGGVCVSLLAPSLWAQAPAQVSPPPSSNDRASVTGDKPRSLTDASSTASPAAANIDKAGSATGMVTLNFPETLELRVLVEYISKRLNLNFLYDETVAAKRVTLKVPAAIPSEALLTLFESVLKSQNLMAVPTEVPGLMRIENINKLAGAAGGTVKGPDAQIRPTQVVTRVFELRHNVPGKLEQILAPFLSGPQANTILLADRGLLIVSDFASNIARVEELLATMDRPRREVSVSLVQVQHAEVEALSQKVTQLLTGIAKSQGAEGVGAGGSGGVTIMADARTNQLALVGLPEDVKQAEGIIRSLDVPLGLETKIYRLSVASPEQVDRLVKSLIGEDTAKRLYKSTTDSDASLLVATTTPQVHSQIAMLLESLDKPLAAEESPIRFYKLENAKALDVISTLQDLEGDLGSGASVDGLSTVQGTTDTQQNQASGNQLFIPGPTDAGLGSISAGYSDSVTGSSINKNQGQSTSAKRSIQLKDARLIADEATNTIIMIAPPSTHAVYEKLIQRLDIRRPQVLVEVTIVLIDTSDDFELGVEFSRKTDSGDGQVLNFTSFGLSSRTPAGTGPVTFLPGAAGFTGALLSSDIADVIIRALAKDEKARVLSRPQILVNDNATGTLISENEEPFSTLIATGEASREGFGGFVKAGTNLTIVPQISEGDFLKLEYDATLSSFGPQEDGTNLPPSRETNQIKSQATIPDGHTIVVGGLTRENRSSAVQKVPFLGDIPLLEYAFSSRTMDSSKATLYIFIRPTILRDDKFKHLKVLSSQAATQAQLEGDFPDSAPQAIR